MGATERIGRGRSRRGRLLGSSFALFVLAGMILPLTSCNHAGPQVRILAGPVDACMSEGLSAAVGVNQLVSFEGRLVGEEFTPEECSWEWQFGDGGSADGTTAWHQYRSPGPTGSWEAELTVTAPDGARGFASATFEMEEPLCGYVIQAVGTCTRLVDRTPLPQPRPDIPESCQFVRHEAGVEAPWWEIPADETVYLLAELFALPGGVSQVECCWSIYFRGASRDGDPELVGVAEWREVALVEHADLCNAAVLLEIGPEDGMDDVGWYEVFARVTAPSTPARDYIGFLLYVTDGGGS